MTSIDTTYAHVSSKRLRTFAVFFAATVAIVAGACCFSTMQAQAETAEPSQTTATQPAETEVSQSAPVRVAFFPLDGFYEYDAEGDMTGYGVEYFNAVADSAGIEYEYVPAASWVEALKMFDEGSIDVLAPSQMTAERNETYRFCPLPIGMEYGSLLALSTNDSLTYEDFSTLNGMKVGCVQSIVFMDSFMDYQQAHGFNMQFECYKDTPALLAALKSGEVDVILANLMVKTDNMKVLGKFGAAPIYSMVSPDNPQLQTTLNDALQSYTTSNPSFQSDLTDKYFQAFNQAPFTKQELAFASTCPTLNVGVASNAAPLAHIDESGEACGSDIDILNEISKISGLRFNYVPLPEGSVDESYLAQNNIALVTGMEANTTNAKLPGLHLSKSYQTMSKVYVGDPTRTYDMDGFIRVAVAGETGDTVKEITDKHPNYRVTQYDTTDDCLQAIENDYVDVLLQNRYLVERLLSNPHYDNLDVLPIEGVTTDYSFCLVDSTLDSAIGDEHVDLFKSIINKSITQVPEQTISEFLATEVVESQYVPSFADMAYQYRLPLTVIVIAILCVIAALIFAMQVKERNRRRVIENEQKLANITNNINGGVLVINGDDSLLITFANDGFLDLIGCTRKEFEQVYHNSYLTYVHEDDVAALKDVAAKSLDEEGERISLPLRLRRDDDTYLDTLFNGTVRVAPDGTRQMYCVVTDISEQVSLLNELTLEKNRADLFFQKSDNVIYEVNLQDRTISTTENMLDMLGWTLPKTIPDASGNEIMNMWRTDGESKEKLLEATRKLLTENVDAKCTVPLDTSMGTTIWCEIDQYPVIDNNGQLVSVVGRVLDVDDAMAEKARLEKLAQTDSMTGLMKKEPFIKAARDYLDSNRSDNCALLFFDVDHFKDVNDTLGHELGDECLKDVAHKLSVAFSGLDLIGRFGGDEFVVFVKSIPSETLVDKLEWLLTKLKQEYTNGDASLSISCSIGAASTQDFGRQYDQLMKYADEALYEAKDSGRGQFVMAKPNNSK